MHHSSSLILSLSLKLKKNLTYHKYKDSELRPVSLWLHLLGHTALTIIFLSHKPLDKPSIHAPAGTARTLPCNPRQLPFYTEYLGQCVNCKRISEEVRNDQEGWGMINSTWHMEEWAHLGNVMWSNFSYTCGKASVEFLLLLVLCHDCY